MRRRFTVHGSRWMIVVVFALALAQPAQAQTGMDVTVHYVEGKPADGQMAYNVVAYASVTDSAGNPINDLKPEDFTLTEDSQQVQISSAALAMDDPINIVLLLDTSGSMSGPGIAAAKSAASNFVNRLNPNDRVAIATFDDNLKTIIDFTTDHAAARNELALIDATRGAGTCLYDAAYQAVQMTATVPSGQRAVILFTDGVDETPSGGACSTYTADDVIHLAREGGTRTPIYTLGLGTQVDQNALKRLAESSGGRFLYSPDLNQLDAIFLRLSDSLRSQYALRYVSTAGPGPHTLAVTAKYLSAQDTDTRNFLLPNFPLRLNFLEPAEGAQLNGIVTLKAEASGQGGAIQNVTYQINDTTVGSGTTSPYEVKVDLSGYPEGNLTIVAIAQAADGSELARVSRTVQRVAAAPATATPKAGDGKTGGKGLSLPLVLAVIAVGFLLLVLVVLLAIFLRRRADQRRRDEEWARQVGGAGESTATEMPVANDRTIDSWDVSPDALAMLMVTASDDASMVNHRFEITKSLTTLGRSADNDIPFPKDSPVSRHHAQLEERNGGLWLSEVAAADSSGTAKRPTYGTFVNDKEVGAEPRLLVSGDEVRLGKRVRLRYEAGQKLKSAEASTLDDFQTLDPDKTQEM